MRRQPFKTFTELSEFVSKLPEVERAERERSAAISRERKRCVDQIAECRARAEGRDGQVLRKAVERTIADVSAADAARAAAIEQAGAAQRELNDFNFLAEREITRLERELISTADPSINEFIDWAFDELHNTLNVASRGSGPDWCARMGRRCECIRSAIDAAQALRLKAEVDVGRELTAIRDAIPPMADAVATTPARMVG